MDPSGTIFDQEILYDWKPLFCNTCLQVGHSYQEPSQRQKAPAKPSKQQINWVQKGPTMNANKEAANQGVNKQMKITEGQQGGTQKHNDGWKEIRGKSASKGAHGNMQEHSLQVTNGFSPLCVHDNSIQLEVEFDHGQCSRDGEMLKPPDPNQAQ
nr:uncharacterized protein LOC117279958 [Nicotiana tomentosiformis]